MDRTEDENNNADDNIDANDFVRFANTATSADTAPVIDDPANAQPVFVEGATAKRYVEEDDDCRARPRAAPRSRPSAAC